MKKEWVKIRRTLLVFLVLIFILAVSVGVYLINPLSYKVQVSNKETEVTNQQLYQVGDLKIVSLKGSPYQMGYQHGSLLKDEVKSMIDLVYWVMDTNNLEGWARLGYTYYADMSYYRQLPAKYQQELQGIADGADVKVRDLLLINVFDELYNLSQCTNAAVWGDYTQGDQIVHGRNLDYYHEEYLWDQQVVFLYEPVAGHQSISVAWPGYVGVLTGMNDQGLTLGVLSSVIKESSLNGIPCGMLYREVLTKASTIGEVETILHSYPRTIGQNLMITSKNDGRGIVFEITPTQIESWSNTGHVTVANHFDILSEQNTEPFAKESVYRRNRAIEIIEEKRRSGQNIDYLEMIKLLGDRLVNGRGTRAIANYLTVQSVVFLPVEGEIWISANDVVPASLGTFWGFKYQPESSRKLELIDNTSVNYDYLLSQAYFHRREPEYWTVENVERVIHRYSRLNAGKWEVAGFYRKVGRPSEAVPLFEEVIEENDTKGYVSDSYSAKDIRNVQVDLAKAYYESGMVDEAIDLFSQLSADETIPDWIIRNIENYLNRNDIRLDRKADGDSYEE